jgi:hypothetical protein
VKKLIVCHSRNLVCTEIGLHMSICHGIGGKMGSSATRFVSPWDC